MHYKNGREAKQGDVVLNTKNGNVGILYETVAGIQQCSARIAKLSVNDEYTTVGDCLHLEDVAKASIPDSTANVASAS